jgi:hypothetical protein
LEKPNRLYTPKRNILAVPETVTIIDPRHPLYDHTFSLLHIKNKQELIPSCLVRLAEGAERLIPISVTNLAVETPNIFPSPIDISSLHELTQVFLRLVAQIEKECGDGTIRDLQFSRNNRSDTDRLDDADDCSTRNILAGNCSDMLSDCHTTGSTGGS